MVKVKVNLSEKTKTTTTTLYNPHICAKTPISCTSLYVTTKDYNEEFSKRYSSNNKLPRFKVNDTHPKKVHKIK